MRRSGSRVHLEGATDPSQHLSGRKIEHVAGVGRSRAGAWWIGQEVEAGAIEQVEVFGRLPVGSAGRGQDVAIWKDRGRRVGGEETAGERGAGGPGALARVVDGVVTGGSFGDHGAVWSESGR